MEKLVTQLASILKDYRSDESLSPTPQIIKNGLVNFRSELEKPPCFSSPPLGETKYPV